MHIPTQSMASPTHMSAAGVSLEVNIELVRLSSEEFRDIGWSWFLVFCSSKNPGFAVPLVGYVCVCVCAQGLTFMQADASPW